MITVFAIVDADRATGPIKQLVQLAEKLSAEGRCRIVIGCAWPKGVADPPLFSELEKSKIPFVILGQRFSFDPALLTEAARAARKFNAQVIQTHGYKASVIGPFLRRMTGLPWVAFMHGNTAENFKVRCYFMLESLIARRADRIITVSDAMRVQLLKVGFPSEYTVTVHNAIEHSLYAAPLPGLTREQFSIDNDSFLLGLIGRFSPEKDPLNLLAAFKMIANKREKIRIILVGEGQEEHSLRAYCRENNFGNKVIFAGYRSDIASFYPLFDLLVISSWSEGLPNVALEAMAASVPVVATSVGGIPEVVIHGQTGLLVPAKNPQALAEAILELVDDPIRRRVFAEAGEVRVKQEFDAGSRSGRMQSIYADVLNENRDI